MSTEIIVSEEYIRATELHKRYKANMYSAAMSIVDAGKCLSEMKKDKLYKQFGYQKFDEYCENEAKIGRDQAYKMIRIVENLPEDFVESARQIGIEKLATLALLPFEQVQEVVEHVDVESVTVKELKAEVAALRLKNEELSEKAEQVDIYAQQFDDLTADKKKAEDALASKDKQFKAAMESKQNELDDFRAGAKRRQDNLMKKIGMLNDQIKELEERPVEHDVVDNSEELESLKRQLSEAQAALQEAQRQLAEKPMVQDALPVEPIQVVDKVGEFKAYLTTATDNLKRLYEFIEQHKHDKNMPLFLERTGSIISFANSELSRLKGE